MNLNVKKPELQTFISEQVRSGSFRTGDDVVEEAVARMMQEENQSLSDQDMRAIDESEEQIDRGESMEFDDLAAEMRRKYPQK